MFASASPREGMYESFYLRALSPTEPIGAWIRYTVHKRPGERPKGSLWCTVFDARAPAPSQYKHTTEELGVPRRGWIAIGADSSFGADFAEGACGQARWSLRFQSTERELRHLPRQWMYRAPLPRTKLTSPAPAARFRGTLELGDRRLELEDWPGMVGHNWGSEHAERWIWLHAINFQEDPDAWLDLAIGRIGVAGRMTPWVANGALSLGGERHRLGGLRSRGLSVRESATSCSLRIAGEHGLTAEIEVKDPPRTAAGWSYADPDGATHDVVNCSIAQLSLNVREAGRPALELHSDHGAAYELGMREHHHGIPIAPFPDG